MKVLIVGGAGFVGTILRPELEAAHECRYFDRKPIPEAAERTLVGDVNDEAAIDAALSGEPRPDAVIYLALGVASNGRFSSNEVDGGFEINTKAVYRWLRAAMNAGVRKFIYASTLEVYNLQPDKLPERIDESLPTNSFSGYGVSKRLGEVICEQGARVYPDATILALRLYLPRDDAYWAEHHAPGSGEAWKGSETGPGDLRQLFLAALRCDKPGAHIVQASGKPNDDRYPNQRISELLGWLPVGE